MTPIRNNDGKIVCYLDEETGQVEIKVKGCTTLIKKKQDGKPEVLNFSNSDNH